MLNRVGKIFQPCLVALRFPIALFCVARVALSLWAIVIVLMLKPPASTELARTGTMIFQSAETGWGNLLLEPWNRWDTHWYLKIAAQGYSVEDRSVAFFPLYPFLVRIIGGIIGGQWLLAGLIVSNLAALGSFVLLYQMVARQFDAATARRTLMWLVAFPMSFFLFAAYTESLFVFFALLVLRYAQTRAWDRAGIFTGLATLTRAPGALLIIPLLYEWIVRWRRGQARARDGARILIGSSIGLGYWLYLGATFGDFSVWSRAMAFWRTSGFPGQSIAMTIQLLFSNAPFGLANLWVDLIATLFFIAAIIWGAFRLPPTWTMYSVASLLPPLLSVQTVVPMLPLASLPRYGIIAFPIFVSLGLARARPRLQFLGLVTSVFLQLFFVALFVEWIWIA